MALTDSLTSYWSGNNVLTDEHGGKTLTNNNSTPYGTGLVYANAWDCETGNSNYLSRADDADLSGGSKNFAVLAWVNLESATTGQILGKGTGTGFEYMLEYNAAADRFRWRVASGDAEAGAEVAIDGGGFGAGNPPSLATWYMVMGWHDEDNQEIGIASSANSLTAYTIPHTPGVWDSTGDFNIGRPGTYFPAYFDGLIGPVMHWLRVPSGAERTQLFNAGAGLTYAAMGGGAATTARPPARRPTRFFRGR
jgi:hypothetical protein